MWRSLLLLGIVGAADVSEYPSFWPKPRVFSNGTMELSVVPGSLMFHSSMPSPLLDGAWKRTTSLMFPWTSDSISKEDQMGSNARLTEVFVEVKEIVSLHVQPPTLGVNERYHLDIVPSTDDLSWKCNITAETVWGAMHGLITLSQMVEPLQPTEEGKREYVIRAAPWSIEDYPVLPHRGLMIDTARHFLPTSTIRRQIDALSMNKMNVLHWHVSDAESMPYESTAFPDLAAKGAFIKEATYSKQEVKDIIDYAAERGVRVIIEFDMPGHNYAWSLAYPSLFVNCSDMYPTDTRFWVASFDPTNEKLYSFLDTFLREVAQTFPDQVIHLGGDEVQYSCWNESRAIREYMAKHNLTLTDLYATFESKVHSIAAKYNKSVQSWDEVYVSAKEVLPKDAIVQVWRGMETLTDAVKDGFRAVLSAPYYLNSGFDMGGLQVSWTSIYSNDPIPQDLTKQERDQVLGAEACIWGEEVNQFNIDQRVWFRGSMLAERLWSLQGNHTDKIGPAVPNDEGGDKSHPHRRQGCAPKKEPLESM
eukprot:jgi/Bigna1/66779/fgenesh1_pg.2_\